MNGKSMEPIVSNYRLPEPVRGSVTSKLLHSLQERQDQIVISDGVTGYSLTGAALRDQIHALAGGLKAAGLGSGQVVALILPNSPQWCVVFHALLGIGCVVTPVNPAYTAPEIARQIKATDATAVFTQSDMVDKLPGGDLSVFAMVPDAVEPLSPWLGAPIPQLHVPEPEGLALMPFSSGTTGVPKGVPLTHANIACNLAATMQMIEVKPGEATLGFLPFFHIYGLATVMNAYLISGGHVVTLPRFDVPLAVDLIDIYRMSQLFIVPPAASLLLAHPAAVQADLSSIDYILSAAAPLGDTVQDALEARLECTVCEGFGMTELSSFSHIAPRAQARKGSCGLLMAGARARIVDPQTGSDLGANQVGELWLSGPQVMAGYVNAHRANADSFPELGWLRTGDLAEVDSDGHLFLRGRTKDILKVRGFQVSPAEVEGALMNYPGITEAALTAVPTMRGDEVLVAFIKLHNNQQPDCDAIRAHLMSQLAGYKLPRQVLDGVEIPKSAAGKIDRTALRALAQVRLASKLES